MPDGNWDMFFDAAEDFIKGTGLRVVGMILITFLLWKFFSNPPWGKKKDG